MPGDNVININLQLMSRADVHKSLGPAYIQMDAMKYVNWENIFENALPYSLFGAN